MTSNKELVLSLKIADCVPVYIYDIQHEVIGLIHAGWRGIASGIIENTIDIMIKKAKFFF